jgi:molybdate transport system substrate-binding protein
LFAATPFGLAAVILASGGALAQETSNRGTTDLAVSCDLAAGPAVIAAGVAFRQRTGVRVRVFPTAPGLLLPQLERDIQNDILVTQVAMLDRAQAVGLVAPGGRAGPWRNRLVTATARQPAAVIGTFVVPDASPGSDIDGHAILQRLGVPSGQAMGVIDTAAVAWTLVNGGARQGLLHQTEVVADERLVAVSPVPDSAWPPILYAATVTKLARRGDPAAFVAFLGRADGIAALRSAGLESVS